jgi:hypothetical protein
MLGKYYSLDECSNVDVVMDKLEQLQEDGKIYFSIVEQDVIKIRDSGLSPRELKDLVSFFEKTDVIEYLDYEDIYSDEEDEDFEDDEDDEYEDDF